MRVTSSNRLTVKPADSQTCAEVRSAWVGNPAKAPNRIISMPL